MNFLSKCLKESSRAPQLLKETNSFLQKILKFAKHQETSIWKIFKVKSHIFNKPMAKFDTLFFSFFEEPTIAVKGSDIELVTEAGVVFERSKIP